MIDLGQKRFVFNGKDFDPSTMYVLQARAESGTDDHIFASGKATPSGNLHVEGTWTADAGVQPASPGFGVVAGSVMAGTIQRAAGEFCDKLTYADAYQTFTAYLPAQQVSVRGRRTGVAARDPRARRGGLRQDCTVPPRSTSGTRGSTTLPLGTQRPRTRLP